MLHFSIGKLHKLALNSQLDKGIAVHGGVRVEEPTMSLEVEYSTQPKDDSSNYLA